MILPTYDDVVQAAERLKGYSHRTPVLTSRLADETTGASIYFKCENFQRTGAFKFRGALNALAQFDKDQRSAGAAAFSGGNHAQGIALSAKLLGMPATVAMPSNAPASKIEATRGYGATVVLYDRYKDDRESIGRHLAEQRGMTLIPSYDHPHVIAGQGTAAKELLEEVGALDALFVGLGGGGMLAGTALSVRALSPDTKVYGVEPHAGNDGQRSLQTGSIVHIAIPETIADGAQAQHLGNLTFEIIKRDVDAIFTVSDEELIDCMQFFASRMKVIVEPTGCLGLAGAKQVSQSLKGKRVGVIITGGNVDLSWPRL